MRLRWLELGHFRSYSELRFEPDPAVNILVGPNGSGKSNLIEAIAYLSQLKSFRGAPDSALVATGGEAAIVRGEFSNQSDHLVEVELPASGRRAVRLDTKRPKRYSDLAALLKTVAFLPDDLALVKGGPVGRRGYLDDLAATLSAVAGGEQNEYDQMLRQRNSLLRQYGREANREELESWENGLARTGAQVLARRLEIARALVPVLSVVYGEIATSDVGVGWTYHSAGLGELDDLQAPDDAEERLADAMAAARGKDMDRRLTTVGPHRDVPDLELATADARTRISQGEQRTLALALRLAAWDLIVGRSDERPLLLLDDVFSELDASRASGVVRRLPEAQVFVTTARPEDVPVEGHTWQVGEGTLT